MSEQQPERDDHLRPVKVRRAPRYGVFLGTGAVLGVLVAVVLGLAGSGDPDHGRGSVIGYLAMLLALLGALLGGVVAVVLDRRR